MWQNCVEIFYHSLSFVLNDKNINIMNNMIVVFGDIIYMLKFISCIMNKLFYAIKKN